MKKIIFLIIRKNIILITFFILFFTSLIISTSLNNNNKFEEILLKEKESLKEEKENKAYNYFRELSEAKCAETSYSKSDIEEECNNGPSSYNRVLKYNSFSNYISSHSYHSNGLNYVTSLFVDNDSHDFGNFMNDGVGMIILYIIDGLLLICWVPLLCCWHKRCCLFGRCLYEDDCCIIFWHILTYFLAAAILSFLIVVLCFGG